MPVLRLVWRDGREEAVTSDGDTVLEAAEAADVSIPFGCRTGVCGTCTGRLLDGDLEHERLPRALKERHLDDGYVLPCIAVPVRDSTVEVGTAVHRDLLTNPWKQRRTDTEPRTDDGRRGDE